MSGRSYKKQSRIIAPQKHEVPAPTYQEKTEREKNRLDFIAKIIRPVLGFILVIIFLFLKLYEYIPLIPGLGWLMKIFGQINKQ